MRTEPRPLAPPAIDAATRQIIHGILVVDRASGTIAIRIPMKLEGTNQGMWGGHWSKKRRATEEWETRLKFVMADYLGRDTIAEFHPHYLASLGLPPVQTRRAIQVRRLCPKRANFMRDDDHTPMAQKPLLDAIKRLGFIRQDSRDWVNLKPLVQEVSNDGKWWTEIEISIPPGPTTPPTAAKAKKASTR